MAERPLWQPGDLVRLKKPHACGGQTWRVTRVGMDMGLSCLTCGRELRLPRWDFEHRLAARLAEAASEESNKL